MGTAMFFGILGKRVGRPRTFMGTLARDARGNTLALMAIALIPLAGMVGGGLDLSRLYLVKTRLQHACDAGALAGRKAQGGGQWTQNNNYPGRTASQFFNANFVPGSYGAINLQSAFSENSGKVTGVASATVPLTLVKVVTASTLSTVDLAVTCDAEERLPNTDVMFVLDNTGSMGAPLPGDTQSKISALKTAVKCFYEIVARLNTTATCATGDPSGGVGSDVQVRFGFVPYDTNVKVGYLLPTEYFANQWTYQSRSRDYQYGVWASFDANSGTYPNPRNASAYGSNINSGSAVPVANSSQCKSSLIPIPADTYTLNGNPTSWADTESATGWHAYAPYIHRTYFLTYNSSPTKTCQLQYKEQTLERRSLYNRSVVNAAGAVTFPAWKYAATQLDISGLKAGSGVNWNTAITLPIGNGHTDKTVNWDGCIEERHTVRQTSYDPIPADAKDLDIDLIPTQSDPDSLWAPALKDVIYARTTDYNGGSTAPTTATLTRFVQSYPGFGYGCPVAAAKKMQAWTTPSDFESYVDSMTPGQNTYHDIGLVWGARLMSPTGLFQSENQVASQGGEIQRHMIFMTDGDACVTITDYAAHGHQFYDRRETDPAVVPTDGCQSTTNGTLTQQISARAAALCTAIKNKNITLWVIWFGTSSPAIEAQLTTCASPGRFYSATNAAALQTTFASIANQISQLRLTK